RRLLPPSQFGVRRGLVEFGEADLAPQRLVEILLRRVRLALSRQGPPAAKVMHSVLGLGLDELAQVEGGGEPQTCTLKFGGLGAVPSQDAVRQRLGPFRLPGCKVLWCPPNPQPLPVSHGNLRPIAAE